MRVIIVARVSHVDGSQSTEAQVHDLKNHCSHKNWDILHIIETKESVKQGRKDHGVFHQAIKDYQPDAFIFTETCRISRDLLDLLLIIDHMHKNNVAVFILSFGGMSLDEEKLPDASTMAMIRMQGLFAQMDNDNRSRRVKSGCRKGLKPLHAKTYCSSLTKDEAMKLFSVKKSGFIDKKNKVKATDIRLAEIYGVSSSAINIFYNKAKKVGLKKYLDEVDLYNSKIQEEKLRRASK